MRAKGITYDTGFIRHGATSRAEFDPLVAARELQIIRDDLGCTAVRLTGGDPGRLEAAARLAAGLGMEVWFSPYPLELTTDEMLALFADCARRAERVRSTGATVVFVTGAELSLMNPGFLPGSSTDERVRLLMAADDLPARVVEASDRVNALLSKAVAVVREHFAGPLTYASIPLERVDWDPFAIVSMDLYRSAEIADRFAAGVRTLVARDKPVAITEFGASTYRGGGDRGARGMEVVEYDERTGAPLRLDGVYERDELGQARYLRELLEMFDGEGVDSAFVFLFALSDHVHRPDGDPRDDLDLASPSIVKVLDGRHGDTYPDMAWEPKAAFHALAAHYRAGP